MLLTMFKLIFTWLRQKLYVQSFAEIYLSQSIDRADFSFREKRLQQKGLL